MSTNKVILGVLAGLATGAILGILFAPDKGSETRKKISKKTTDTLDDIKHKFESLYTKAQKVSADGKEELKRESKVGMS